MDIQQFEYTGYPGKVFFGENAFTQVSKLLSAYRKAFVIAGNRHEPYVNDLRKILGAECIFHFNRVVQHVPVELIEKAYQKQDSGKYGCPGGDWRRICHWIGKSTCLKKQTHHYCGTNHLCRI